MVKSFLLSLARFVNAGKSATIAHVIMFGLIRLASLIVAKKPRSKV